MIAIRCQDLILRLHVRHAQALYHASVEQLWCSSTGCRDRTDRATPTRVLLGCRSRRRSLSCRAWRVFFLHRVRSPADTSPRPLPSGRLCKDSQVPGTGSGDAQHSLCRCPGKRAATPKECRVRTPYTFAEYYCGFGDRTRFSPARHLERAISQARVGDSALDRSPVQIRRPPTRCKAPPVSDPLRQVRVLCSATGSSLTRASTLQHRARQRSMASQRWR